VPGLCGSRASLTGQAEHELYEPTIAARDSCEPPRDCAQGSLNPEFRAEHRVSLPCEALDAHDGPVMAVSSCSGKVAIITGGASGIGAALAKEIAKAGAEVVLADRQIDLAERVATEIRAAGGRCAAREADVRSLPSLTRVVEDSVRRLGAIDYFFNNAGIGIGGEIANYEPRDWDDVFDVNLRGVTNGIQAVYPLMIGQRAGHIINTASMAGLVATPGEGAYGASKHAVVGLSKTLRMEGKRHGVRVSVLCPGAIRTPILTGGKYGRTNMVGLTDEKILEMWAKLRPMDVGVFAKKALRAVLRNEAIIIVPAWWKAFWYIDRLSPALSAKVWEAMLGRMFADLEAAGVRPRSATREEKVAQESNIMRDARNA
jgi:NAD(P)-dependent dehydrogenase (short-subunit alcohol dehydrogenase family)